MSGKELNKAIKNVRTIKIPQLGSKTYDFKIYPFGERGTYVNYALISEVSKDLANSIKYNFSNFDYIVSPEPGGHTWGILVASILKKDINILRTQPSFGNAETEVSRKTGYYQDNLYFTNFKKGDKVLIIDDVISTGGTLDIIINTLVSKGVKVIGVQVIYAKSKNYLLLERKYRIKIKTLK